MSIQTFTASLSEEKSGSIRGKIPATLVTALGATAGDVLEFQVNGKTLVGGRVVKGKEAQKIKGERQYFGRAAGTQAVKKPVKAQVAKPTKAGNGKAVTLPKPSLAKPSLLKKPVALAKPVAKKTVKPHLVAKPAPSNVLVKPPVKLAKPAPKTVKRATKVIITKPKVVAPKGKAKPRFSI